MPESSDQPRSQQPTAAPGKRARPKITLRFVAKWLVIGLASLWLFFSLLLVALRWIDSPTTAVHMERHLQASLHGKPYTERYDFVPLSEISLYFQHAVIAAEDGRFYQHHGFDWDAIQLAAEGDVEGGKIRGGSTITQQLVKNPIFGTGRSFMRKGAQFTRLTLAEIILGTQPIL